MGILIQNGRVIDAASETDRIMDIYIKDDKIAALSESIDRISKEDTVINAEGMLVLPGLVDMHVHLRDPGQTDKEDIVSGAKAAARGGVTTIVAMPNTSPVVDSPDRLAYVLNKAKELAPVNVLQTGSLTAGEKGLEVSDIKGMAKAGAIALSEDGKSVMNSRVLRNAMLLAAEEGLPILDHCEDIDLRGSGCMNDDRNAERLGLPGIPNATEDSITARDIAIAVDTGVHLHLCHVSTAGCARIMQALKREGINGITAEVCPHHLILSSDDIIRDDPDFKMNPPLRTPEDVKALREALADGSIQVISTDHAPHTRADKAGSMKTAAFGIVGLETSFSLIYTELVLPGVITLMQLVEKMCLNPARILGLSCGIIAEGRPADIVIIDPEASYTIDKNKFASKGRNTPFHGRSVKGRVIHTICGGKEVYSYDK
ncbi:MAG: dihydroorotase [Blautia sp.]|nr:dihydroorotase [Blautia sp.]